MYALLNFFVDLCLLRRKPQDLPASQPLLVLALPINLSIGVATLAPQLGNVAHALLACLLDLTLSLGLVAWVLRLRGHYGRWLQTATALVGTGILLGLAIMPLVMGGEPAVEGAPVSTAAMLSALALLFLLIWAQVVTGHILRHAFDIPLPAGIGLAVGYFLFMNALLSALFATS